MPYRQADPSNLEVLLSLGVSHTNELDQAEALEYMRRWLQEHPKFTELASSSALPDGPLLVQPVSTRHPSLALPSCTTLGEKPTSNFPTDSQTPLLLLELAIRGSHDTCAYNSCHVQGISPIAWFQEAEACGGVGKS